MNDAEKHIRQQRINKVILKRIKKKLLAISKLILKVIGWALLFGIILIFSEPEIEKPLWIIATIYITLIINFVIDNKNYREWQKTPNVNSFNRRFCTEWHPSIFGKLVVFWFALKYFDLFGFIISFLFVYCMDLWDRRYITNNIKNDMILEELLKQ